MRLIKLLPELHPAPVLLLLLPLLWTCPAQAQKAAVARAAAVEKSLRVKKAAAKGK
jgi:hypothetical protein